MNAKTTAPKAKPNERASIGAGRLQAARNRTKERGNPSKGSLSNKERTSKTGGITQGRPSATANRGTGKSQADKGARDSSKPRNTNPNTGQRGSLGKAAIDARERARKKTARDDYIQSAGGLRRDGDISSGTGSGRPSAGQGGGPALDRGQFRPSSGRGSLTGNRGSGNDITPGSRNDRHLDGRSHRNHGYNYNNGYNYGWRGGSAWSNCYWNWNSWGSGYGWAWCPALWASSYWWDCYWYNGGSWSYGRRPNFYYYGPGASAQYQIVLQTVQEPIYVEQEQEYAPAGEAVAPAVVIPQKPAKPSSMNRAAEYYLNLGDRSFQSGRYADAVHHYGKAVEYAPKEGILYLILSDALFATADYNYGAFALRKAFELDPSLADLTVNKRSFYGVPSDLDLQLTRARSFVKQNPQDADALLMLAANELFTGSPGEALQLLDAVGFDELRNSPTGRLLAERAIVNLDPKLTPALEPIEASAEDLVDPNAEPVFEIDDQR